MPGWHELVASTILLSLLCAGTVGTNAADLHYHPRGFFCDGGSKWFENVFQCDGRKDCNDGFDEDPATCTAYNCAGTHRVKCPSSQTVCTAPENICNGVRNCPNGTDEAPGFCRGYRCLRGSFKCPVSWVCIPGAEVCDGVDQCPKVASGFAADEVPSFCLTFQCAKGRRKCADSKQCLQEALMCDGKADCKDQSDESSSQCRKYDCTLSGRIRCPRGAWCLPSSCHICDGSKECAYGSDEWPRYCFLRNSTVCGPPSIKSP